MHASTKFTLAYLNSAEYCSSILAHRTVKGGAIEYLVKWLVPEGAASDEPETWEPALNFPVDEWEQAAPQTTTKSTQARAPTPRAEGRSSLRLSASRRRASSQQACCGAP